MTIRDDILDEASILIHGDRQKDYGPPDENFRRIADMWSVVLDKSITPTQVALCMACLKIARLVNQPNHYDSYVDAAGYIAIGGELAEQD